MLIHHFDHWVRHRTFLLPPSSSRPKARCTQRFVSPCRCCRKALATSQALNASQHRGSSAINQATRAHHSGVRWATSFKACGTQLVANGANELNEPRDVPQRFHRPHRAAWATCTSAVEAACSRMAPSVSWSFKWLRTGRSSSLAAATQAASKRFSTSFLESLWASCSWVSDINKQSCTTKTTTRGVWCDFGGSRNHRELMPGFYQERWIWFSFFSIWPWQLRTLQPQHGGMVIDSNEKMQQRRRWWWWWWWRRRSTCKKSLLYIIISAFLKVSIFCRTAIHLLEGLLNKCAIYPLAHRMHLKACEYVGVGQKDQKPDRWKFKIDCRWMVMMLLCPKMWYPLVN